MLDKWRSECRLCGGSRFEINTVVSSAGVMVFASIIKGKQDLFNAVEVKYVSMKKEIQIAKIAVQTYV